ncbi:MAG TPA: maleylpyruvate isomerase family mycothiol-dependent enzyme [Mycobacteriales bacterium]|jgi:uncharacterized protein (TIGR03083 family)
MTPSELYADVRTRVTGLVRDLDDDRLAAVVPGCPAWTVKDLVAHCAAVVTDAHAGNFEGAGSDEWTQRQVTERRDAKVGDLIAEWERGAAAIEPKLDEWPKAISRTLLVDLVTHEHDLRGAIGVPGGRDSEAYEIGRKAFHVGLAKTIEQRGLPGLRLAADDGWSFDAGPEPAVTVTAPDSFELFRGLSGRRSRGQVLSWRWSGDADPYLPILNRFGPLPETDVVEPV